MGHVDRRQPPRDRERRAGQEREPQPLRVGHHLGALGPVRREMLVVEDGDAAAARLEDLDDLLEELIPRIERLPLVVLRIVPMLADDDDAIDGELRGPQGQRLGDGRHDRHAMPLGPARARSSLGN